MTKFLRTPFEKFLAYLVLGLVGFVMVFPFFYMFTSSIKPHAEIVQIPPALFPQKEWLWGNYAEVLKIVPIGTQLINSVIVTTCVTLGWVTTSILAGYAFARIPFPGANALFSLYIGTLMVPFAVLLVPMYLLMSWLGWVDKLVALIVPWLFTAYGTFLLRQAFMGLPRELEEAALIDGSTRWGALFRIYVPLVYPAIATLATISFLYSWNSFTWPLVVISNKDLKVVTQGLMDLQALYGGTRLDLVMAGSVMAVLPTLGIYLAAQRYFIEGVASSGMGGR
ncbi:MAG: carbohydrate ABC transporter permease [Anaerolineae bacterium]|nr:carbohydrate ABC transporter permease [Anaerolineae bacterium]